MGLWVTSAPQINWVKEGSILIELKNSAFRKVIFRKMNNSLIYSFKKYVLHVFYVPGIFLDYRNM